MGNQRQQIVKLWKCDKLKIKGYFKHRSTQRPKQQDLWPVPWPMTWNSFYLLLWPNYPYVIDVSSASLQTSGTTMKKRSTSKVLYLGTTSQSMRRFSRLTCSSCSWGGPRRLSLLPFAMFWGFLRTDIFLAGSQVKSYSLFIKSFANLNEDFTEATSIESSRGRYKKHWRSCGLQQKI